MSWKDSLAGAWALVSLSLILGLSVNHARGLPLQPGRPYLSRAPGIEVSAARGLQPVWLDARGPGEYRQGHIPGARNWLLTDPVGGLPDDRALVVYCGSHCGLADLLASRLGRSGYERVFVLQGGIDAWPGPLRQGDAP